MAQNKVAGGLGFEPRLTESESPHEQPISKASLQNSADPPHEGPMGYVRKAKPMFPVPPIDEVEGEVTRDHRKAELLWFDRALNTSDGWGSRSLLGEYRDLIELRSRRQMTVTVGHIPGARVMAARVRLRHTVPYGGESREHLFAKHLAAVWIESLGGRPKLEAERYGGRVDVLCEQTGIVVECGSLSAWRLLHMVKDEKLKRAIVLPFTSDLFDIMRAGVATTPFLEFKLVGDYRQTLEAMEAAELAAMRKAFESLELDAVPGARSSPTVSSDGGGNG